MFVIMDRQRGEGERGKEKRKRKEEREERRERRKMRGKRTYSIGPGYKLVVEFL